MTIIDRFLTLCGAPEGEIPCDAYDTAVMAVPFIEAQAATINDLERLLKLTTDQLDYCNKELGSIVGYGLRNGIIGEARKALKASVEKP